MSHATPSSPLVLVNDPRTQYGSFEGDEQDAAVPSSVSIHVQYKIINITDVTSVLPRRVMGSSPDASPAHLPWGKEGDECMICLGEMVAGGEVTDLPVCNHTFHLQCTTQWLTTNVEAGRPCCCPICNAAITWYISPENTPHVVGVAESQRRTIERLSRIRYTCGVLLTLLFISLVTLTVVWYVDTW